MSNALDSLPRSDGFWMPAEWEAHTQTWLLWPVRTDTWRNGAKPAQRTFAELAKTIAHFEPVTVCVPTEQYENACAMLGDNIRVLEMAANDAWIRDCGPTFVLNQHGEVRGVDWIFNAWGGLEKGTYFPWDKDDLVAHKVLEVERLARYRATICTEGGALHVDGEGTLMVVRPTVMNSNRNPNWSQSQLEVRLQHYLNVEKVIWLEDGVYGDETDGHIDNLACFVRPSVVALTWTDDENDPQYAISQAAYDVLSNTSDAKGRPLEIHKIHQPGPLYMTEEEAIGIDKVAAARYRCAEDRLAGSYINFYIANGAVIVPTFNDPHDEAALATLRDLFLDREVIGFYAREILLGGGNIHCITQQQPAPHDS
ncbi:MAG: agmatine deiminase [Anaerolineae bacterium]|nr:agmatine deiminase [Anaerolineae bacterium]MDQ7037253.1 agmatine deiminase [Anaerolineae bacterium]